LAREHADAGVAFLLGIVEMAVEAADALEAPGHILGLGLDFLHAHTIGAQVCRPLDEALVRRRADAVEIQGHETEHFGTSPMSLTQNFVQPTPEDLAQDFVSFAVEAGVLRFGDFKTKAGRMSPYFFNAGLFDDGAKLGRLAQFYARLLVAEEQRSGLQFDMIFGPAYKGIPLAAAVAIELARLGRNLPFAYNRKEAKDHGEGGTLVGAPVKGRVLIVDD